MEPIMTTKRIPIARPRRAQIVPEALDIFDEMKQLKCTCPEGEDGEECPGCELWSRLHSQLAGLLPGIKPWDWPVIENPQAECPYPAGSYAAARWRPNEKGQARWLELEAALAERKKSNTLNP
jgi:hypothetical protein